MYKNLKNSTTSRQFAVMSGNDNKRRGLNTCYSVFNATTFNVILRRERSELSGEFRNIMAILLNAANSTTSRLFSVITGRVPVILVQRMTNLVKKFAILLHKYRFYQDCRNRLCVMSGNDVCWGCVHSVCYQFFKQTYHPGSSANELTLKAKDDYKSVLQAGRSMIEMLGVLAIIAVLSVGGIAGYSKAMDKYKTTKLMGEYNELVRNLLEYRPNFEKDYPSTVGGINFKNVLYNAGLLPAKWRPDYQPAYLRDSAGNYLTVSWDCNNIKPCAYVIVMILGGSGIAYGQKRGQAKRTCMAILQTVIQPLHSVLRIGRGTWALGGSAKPYYGDAYCDDKRQLCLRNMSLADIKASCDPCDVAGRCEVSMYF